MILSWRGGSVVRMSGELSLIYGLHVTTLWVSVRYGSTNQANSAFHPFGIGK